MDKNKEIIIGVVVVVIVVAGYFVLHGNAHEPSIPNAASSRWEHRPTSAR